LLVIEERNAPLLGDIPVLGGRAAGKKESKLGKDAPSDKDETSKSHLRMDRRGARSSPVIEPPKGGELRARVADKLIPIPLKHTDVKAQVSIYIASVTVKQQYHNPYDSKIEAVYVFPLPDDAAVRDFIMVIGDRKIRGIIRERAEAQRIYQQARAQGHVASLLTQDRPNIFTQAVANIEPGKQIDIDITYFHSLKYSKGEYEFHFPMVVGPRYNPAGTTDGIGATRRDPAVPSGQQTEISYLPPDEITAADISLEVNVDAGLPIDKVESPSHTIMVERMAPTRAKVRLSPNDRIPNKDFVLRYQVGGMGIASALAAHRDASGGYFTLVLQPPDLLEDIPATAREMVFVLDVSGSMSGAPLDISKRTMERCLGRLAATDTFQIVCFAGNATTMAEKPLPATPDNIARAKRFVNGLQGNGGTEMLTGIRAALEFPTDPDRYRIVSFMTDGYIGNEQQIFGAVRQTIGSSRIFAFGIGSSVNRFLIEGLGRIGRGTTAFVGLDESSAIAVDSLYQRIEHPALTDIKLEWSGAEVSDVHGDPIPDLFVGRPVVITGRFKGAGVATLKITGKVAGQNHVSTMKVDLDDPGARHAALPAVWARAKIGSLSDRMIFTPDGADYPGQIRTVALEYGLMSNYTAFVAVDSSRRTEGESGTTVPVPVPVPAGVKYETTVGERK
jgi:Ca-activated chloride channel family protein